MMAEYLAELVDELMSLNDDNLAQRVIDNSDVQWCLSELHDILAADVAPVVHGQWVPMHRSGVKVERGYVSTCCDMWAERKSPYCPRCGARMDGGGKARG